MNVVERISEHRIRQQIKVVMFMDIRTNLDNLLYGFIQIINDPFNYLYWLE